MSSLTPFGMLHTAISLVAVAAGIVAFIRHLEISTATVAGRTYAVMTVLTCGTGLFIFHHGGFGKPHVLSILTLAVLCVAYAAERWRFAGAASRYIAVLGYSLTFFFHLVPGFTESATRLPPGHPLVAGPDAPPLQAAIGIAFLGYLVGAVLQLRRLRAAAAPQL